jgi:hypothetical protein
MGPLVDLRAARHSYEMERKREEDYAKRHQVLDPNYQPRYDRIRPLEDRINEATTEIKKRLAVEWLRTRPREKEGWIGDLLRMSPQFAAQILVTAGTGGAGGMAFMGGQIMSSTAIQAIEEGADPERAVMAGVANAIIAAPLEKIGLGKFAGPLQKGIINRLKKVFGSAGREALTEMLQAYPDIAAAIFADEPDIGMLEAFNKVLTDPKHRDEFKKAVVAGGFGGFVMGSGSGIMKAMRRVKPTEKKDVPDPKGTAADVAVPDLKTKVEEPDVNKEVVDRKKLWTVLSTLLRVNTSTRQASQVPTSKDCLRTSRKDYDKSRLESKENLRLLQKWLRLKE